MAPRILVIDNYDSFVYTIVDYLTQMGAAVTVLRNDQVPPAIAGATETINDEFGKFDGVLISPGPGTPTDAGFSNDVIAACARTGTPMLGVCLGHQGLAEVFGGTVIHTPELRHGKTSEVTHQEVGVFEGLPSPFVASRYHSLAVSEDSLPHELQVTATTTPPNSVPIVMGLAHRHLPLQGVQFHPESVLTEYGFQILANWLISCGADDIDKTQLPVSVYQAS